MKVVKLTPGGEPPLIESGTIIEFDCSEWVKNVSDVPIEQWTRVKIARLPDGQATLVADDSAGVADRRHHLELELPAAESEAEVAGKLDSLVAHLSELDVALGGAGLTRTANGSPRIVVLDPNTQAGAEHRLGRIARLTNALFEFAGQPVRTVVKSAA
jgi:hypothetical protein